MSILKKYSNNLANKTKVKTKRVRPDNVSDLTDEIRNSEMGLVKDERAVNQTRQKIPVFNRPKSDLYFNVNTTKENIRRKIKLISSYGKEPTARRRGEYMPRALFNRHNLFGYTGLENFGTIVDRYYGESDNENLSSNFISKLDLNEKPKLDNFLNVDSQTDPRNVLDKKNVYYLYSRSGEEGKKIEEYRKNPTAENIVNYFGQDNPEGKFHAVEYDWVDFAMCKNYNKVPNNQMITLRRFPFPVQDNIYDHNINKYPDIGRMVTWWGEGTNNSLADIMKMEWGFVWKDMQSEMQVIKSGPPSQSLTGEIFGKKVQNLAKLTSTINPASNMFKNTVMQGADFYDFAQHNRMRIDGPVDSIDKIIVRDRGLNFEQKFTLTFEYSLNSYGGINPRLALLDLLGNILFTTYNRGNFWGGGIRYQSDLRQNRDIAIGNTDLLMKGDYFGYLKSVPEAFNKRFKQMAGGSAQGNDKFANQLSGGLSPFLGNFAKPFANFTSAALGNLVDMFFGKAALSSGAFNHMEIPNSLLTNQPVGVWHITVGNPFQPIAVFGNVILEKTSIEFSENLGWDDFPESVKVVCELKHPIAKDRDAIESVFNVGRGPFYHDPYVYNKKMVDKIISDGGLQEYNPYENNYSVTDQGYKFLENISATKFGMGKIINSANRYFTGNGGGNVPTQSKSILQNQIFGWFIEGENR